MAEQSRDREPLLRGAVSPARRLQGRCTGHRHVAARAGRAGLEGFWAEQAERLRWTKPWDQVLEWDLPFAKWFVGGQLNVSDNCLDRHVDAGGGDKVAYRTGR